jgi:hypothetical protein
MNRKKMLIAVTNMALVFLVATFVTAHPSTSNTPLYTLRMEQASSRMNFLPTTMNNFTYITEQGYEANYDVLGCCGGIEPLDTGVWTCYYSTCGGPTCWLTCPASCYGTCYDPTCPATCPYTCGYSCGGTCYTCEETCEETCEKSCEYTSCPRDCEA